MLISHIYYAIELYENHGMNRYYTEELSSMSERINAAIRGVVEPGSEISSVTQRYQSYIGWLVKPQVHCVKFEDMILQQESTLRGILDYLMERGASINCSPERAVDIIQNHIEPKKSGTFRKGVPGGWREHFSDENKQVFIQTAGGLLQQLGYEQNDQW